MLNTLKGLENQNVEGELTELAKLIMTNEDRPLLENGEVDWDAFDELRNTKPICIDHNADMVSFKLMTKPAAEGGKGCQHVDMISVAKEILDYFTRQEEKKLEKLTEDLKGPFENEESSEQLREVYNNTLTSYNCNKQTCILLAGAIHQQMIRTTDREKREVEGTSQA